MVPFRSTCTQEFKWDQCIVRFQECYPNDYYSAVSILEFICYEVSGHNKYKWKQSCFSKCVHDATLFVFIFHLCTTAPFFFFPLTPRLSIRLFQALKESVTRIPFLNQSGVTQKGAPMSTMRLKTLTFGSTLVKQVTLHWLDVWVQKKELGKIRKF